jgi:hypothetical protein
VYVKNLEKKYDRILVERDKMIFYIKDQSNKLYATCRYNKENHTLILNKASLIKKTFNCTGCDTVNKLRNDLINQGKLEDHNDDLYLLMESIEFEDFDSAACLVLGGKLMDAGNLIRNEFDVPIKTIYLEENQ